MQINKILNLKADERVNDYSRILGEDYTATYKGVKFERGAFYTITELRHLQRLKPGVDGMRAIHEVKTLFGGSITHAWNNRS